MKKLTLITAILFITLSTTAQRRRGNSSNESSSSSSSTSMGFSKGNIVVTGEIGFNTKSNGPTKESTFGFVPSGMFFITNNISVGGSIGYRSTTNKTTVGGTSDSTTNSEFIVGAFGRYYLTPKSQFSVFGQGGLEFASQSFGAGGNGTRFGFAIRPGLGYFLTSHVGIEATVGEIGFQSTSSSGTSNTDFNFGFNFTQINFGVNYKF